LHAQVAARNETAQSTRKRHCPHRTGGGMCKREDLLNKRAK
jgi:hypothetical protein